MVRQFVELTVTQFGHQFANQCLNGLLHWATPHQRFFPKSLQVHHIGRLMIVVDGGLFDQVTQSGYHLVDVVITALVSAHQLINATALMKVIGQSEYQDRFAGAVASVQHVLQIIADGF